MSPETNTQTRAGLFAGKARTVAAVAAFSGLALATTVSVQATQNASEQSPAAVVAEAPAAEQTVTAEPAAKSDSSKAEKAEKKEEKAAPKAEVAPAAPAAVQAVPAADVAPAAEAPKAEAAPAAQAPAAEAASLNVAPASENVTPIAPAAPAAEAPAAQGRHAAPATAETQAREAAAAQDAGVAYEAPAAPAVTPASNNTAAPAAKAPEAPAATAEKSTTVAPQSSNTASSSKGQAILGAAEAQIGVTQDCTMLVTNSLKAVGINHHGWPESYKSLGTQVSAAEAKAGDIAYYANGGAGAAHVAIYAGNGQAIHGGWNGNQTVKQTVNVGSGPEFIRVS
ncbi:C40 family peptidase [Kocuria sp. cx-116]|uniref:NlpC/P60 family protein n=1 Tax=Kocuria sp. cx-116 TaxID=2771378 RepID=UPI00168359EA|nr:NlpC/P60 family protein [Kocuria sp. cx-116]MBD2762833.1 C40 family peptidase [Kocuria sp. cx-116]